MCNIHVNIKLDTLVLFNRTLAARRCCQMTEICIHKVFIHVHLVNEIVPVRAKTAVCCMTYDTDVRSTQLFMHLLCAAILAHTSSRDFNGKKELHAAPMRFELVQHALLPEVNWERLHTHA